MLRRREISSEDSGAPVISVVTWATLRVNVGVQGILVDERIIDNAKQRTIALSVETQDISRGNASSCSSLLLMLGRVWEMAKGQPITRPGVCP